VFGKLSVDDYFVILAWLATTAFAIEWQVYTPTAWKAMDQMSGKLPLDETFWHNLVSYINIETGALICQIIGLWCIKYSFLFFFRNLGWHLRYQKIMWWIIFAFVTIGFPIYVGYIPWSCHEHLDNLMLIVRKSQTARPEGHGDHSDSV
jgi:hypothetical protein